MPVAEFYNPTATKCIAFTSDSLHLVGADSENSVNGHVRQWNVGNSWSENSSFGMKSTGQVNAIAASKDGQWIVTGGKSGNQSQVIIWDAVTRTIAKHISEYAGLVYAIDVSSDSTRVASAFADCTVRIFSIISGVRLIPPLAVGNSGVPTAVKFSLDGSRVAAAAYTHVGVYDAHSGNKLLDIPVQNTSSLAWSFDGQQLLFSSLGNIICFGKSTSRHFKLAWFVDNNDDQTIHNNSEASVATHGRFIACAKGLRLSFWDYVLGKQIGMFVDHASVVNCISISPDGKYLACGHQQGITVHNLRYILPQHYLCMPRVPRIPLLQVDDPVVEPWTLGKLTDAVAILSTEITNAQGSDPDYHALTLAARSIVRSRLKQSTANEDAEKSLQVKQSPIGQVAKSLALMSGGETEVALDNFDLAFRDDPACDTALLFVIKSILMFICGKHKQAASRLHGLLNTVDEETKGHYIPVLGNMYLKQGDYESAVQTLVLSKKPSIRDSDPLMTITLIFDWTFDRLEDIACQRLCESLYTSGQVKVVGETLLQMISGLTEDEKEPAHGRILQELVTRSGRTTLLTWTGKSSRCNSCLPSSPAVYSQQPFVSPHLEPAELEKRMDELRALLPHMEIMVIYAQVTRFQPVRFAHFRLHLPCIVYNIKSLQKGRVVYYAETAEFGVVEFRTVDSLPCEERQSLVFADLRIHDLKLGSDTQWSSSDMGNSVADASAELVHAPMIEEVPSGDSEPQLDTYTRALQLLVRLGQPFSALLLLRQSDGSYKRVAADNEIIIRGARNNVPKDIRVEVLEVL